MAIDVAIIYYGATGPTYHMAHAVRQGASEAGADVRGIGSPVSRRTFSSDDHPRT
jgi:hypothetical protein